MIIMSSSNSSTSRCAACKYLRRRCASDCIFSPYFPPNNPQRFASVHRIYGASNVGKMLQVSLYIYTLFHLLSILFLFFWLITFNLSLYIYILYSISIYIYTSHNLITKLCLFIIPFRWLSPCRNWKDITLNAKHIKKIKKKLQKVTPQTHLTLI